MLLVDARDQGALERLLDGLLKLGRECEWVEFKHNWSEPDGIGEYISALSNSAAIAGMPQGFLVWGIEDDSLEIVGTEFDHATKKVGNENLENWLSRLISPRLNLRFIRFEVNVKGAPKPILLLEIDRAFRHPTRFKTEEFVRVGSYTKKFKEHPEKEALLWQQFADVPFEDFVALEDLTDEQVAELLDIEAYFALNRVPISDDLARNLERLEVDELIKRETSGRWAITNLGALLYARNLESFRTLSRKVIRIVRYEGTDRISILK
ncbi:MAG: ATP-binding protein [Fimbriimonadaceae bacterium]|nr:ATP-binding protein [Fimbriimonadaceae bacterium]